MVVNIDKPPTMIQIKIEGAVKAEFGGITWFDRGRDLYFVYELYRRVSKDGDGMNAPMIYVFTLCDIKELTEVKLIHATSVTPPITHVGGR